MSTDRQFNFHFVPVKGWMNDPNGLIYADGKYHIFFQYNPESTVWGPMNWGHAVSQDLQHWNQLENAIEVDENGYAFSGSAFALKKQGLYYLLYTSHNPQSGEQQQCLVESENLETFKKYEKNPVIKNQKNEKGYKKDFRDPKVFSSPDKNSFGAVIAAGKIIEFYSTDDFKNWSFAGSFNPQEYGLEGICECPDLLYFPSQNQNDKKNGKWILLFSMILTEDCMKAHNYSREKLVFYFTGDFDGKTFTVNPDKKEALLLDYGPDAYAYTSFAGVKEPVLMAWGENWDYAARTPAENYRGKMTAPRICILQSNEDEEYLCQIPYLPEEVLDNNSNLYNCAVGESIVYENDLGQSLSITVEEKEIVVERKGCGTEKFAPELSVQKYNRFTAPRKWADGGTGVMVLEDKGYFEIFCEGGLTVFSVDTWADSPLVCKKNLSLDDQLEW